MKSYGWSGCLKSPAATATAAAATAAAHGGEVFFPLLEAGRVSRSPSPVEQWTETGWREAAELDLAAERKRTAAEGEGGSGGGAGLLQGVRQGALLLDFCEAVSLGP